jgi:putative aldouronate transport system permease protein
MTQSKSERIFSLFNTLFLVLISLVFLIPFLMVLGTSFVGEEEWSRRGAYILFPEKIDLTAYLLLLGGRSLILNGAFTSLMRVLVGVSLNLFFTATLAYVLGRKRLPGRVGMTLFVFVTMVFSGGLIPFYVLVDNLRLTNTFWAMIFPVLLSPWNMLIMRNFFMNIPESLETAGAYRVAPFLARNRHYRIILRGIPLERMVPSVPLHQ